MRGARWVMTFERLMGWREKNNMHTFELVCVIRKNMESMLRGKHDCKAPVGGAGVCSLTRCLDVYAYKSASMCVFLLLMPKGEICFSQDGGSNSLS